jgi:uncharacterized membrane protein YraQ (UPF0718 family)
MQDLARVASFVATSLRHVWPLLAISIPFAVALRVSGLSSKLSRAFGHRPVIGILLATAAGAFGPFCSCSVIPVIASMLIGGVPLAPVMSFWIASPTMDPEIFFMSAAILGWQLAVARLVATLLLSVAAGFVTLALIRHRWMGTDFLRPGATASEKSVSPLVRLRSAVRRITARRAETAVAAVQTPFACDRCGRSPVSDETAESPPPWIRHVVREGAKITLWVLQFMLLAFVLEAVITLYIPQTLIVTWIGSGKAWSPALAALIGIPLYTGNLTAMPLIGGLLDQGMSPAAALAFLVAGPVTTIPAMAAVWGVVRRRVFFLYLALGVGGALFFGYLYFLVTFLLRRIA